MGSQARDKYSSVGLTSEVYAVLLTSLLHSPRFLRRNPSVLDALAATVSMCLCQLRSSLMVTPEIFPAVDHFHCVTVEAVCSLYLVALVGNDADDLAFLRMELHLPCLFLFLQGLKISLDYSASASYLMSL